jgi:transcription-repair coupling factor (superfamily II helicase)
MQSMIPQGVLNALTFRVKAGEQYPRPELLGRFVEAGYTRVDLVEAPGEFSVRGDIIDVFSIQNEHPTRLNFFDDELETLNRFDVTSQRSLDARDALTIYPASEGVVTPSTAAAAQFQVRHAAGDLSPVVVLSGAGDSLSRI